jgi:hypothetical protein
MPLLPPFRSQHARAERFDGVAQRVRRLGPKAVMRPASAVAFTLTEIVIGAGIRVQRHESCRGSTEVSAELFGLHVCTGE